MQHIGITIEDELGNSEKIFNLNFAEVLDVLHKHASEDGKIWKQYPWTMSIDPYGKTVFNHLQIPKFINELDEIKKQEGRILNTIDMLTSLIEKENLHSTGKLLCFVGD